MRKIWSDCGTNFTAAEKMLEKAVEECGKQESAVGRPLEWARVAPRASHRAGVWERIIGLTKRILVSLVGKGDTTLDVFRTVLCQAEYILNHRPITHVSADPNDFEALTPAHFMNTGYKVAIGRPDEPLGTIEAEDMRLAHNRALAAINGFWKRWRNEYLATLKTRSKWEGAKKNVEVGQLVLLEDETRERKDWRLGRIITVDGNDGLVRTVGVKTANKKVFTRAVNQIVTLEMD